MKMILHLPRVAISHMTTPKDHLRKQKYSNSSSGGIKLKYLLNLFWLGDQYEFVFFQ